MPGGPALGLQCGVGQDSRPILARHTSDLRGVGLCLGLGGLDCFVGDCGGRFALGCFLLVLVLDFQVADGLVFSSLRRLDLLVGQNIVYVC